MRRLLLSLAFLGLLASSLPTASAQEPAAVRLTLLSQTPWSSTDERELVVRFRAENLGDLPLGELSIGVTLYARTLSRTQYEQALVSDPPVALVAQTLAREGVIEAGQTRDFELTFLLDSPGIDPADSGVYPLKIDLRSGFTSVAALRSAVVFLVRTPEEPLALSWTFVLHEPISVDPEGAFTSSELETAIAPGGRLAEQIGALLELAAGQTPSAVDLAVSPVLLTQLGRMRSGYEIAEDGASRVVPAGEGGALLAQQTLEDLRSIAHAPTVRISALPFSSPELPSLLSAGLGRDVAVQLERGREVVGAFLETTTASSVLRPPGAALDDATLEELLRLGISTIIAGPATVESTPQPLGFAGPPTAGLGQDGGVVAIVPEPGLMAQLQSSLAHEDPIRTAQILLAELASIWQEQPGERRGVALVLSEDLLLPAHFYAAFSAGVASAPWLAPMHAAEFATEFAPTQPSLLTAPNPREFPSSYVEELRQARRRVDTYRSMLVAPSDEPDRYDRMLLLAESRQYLSSPEDGLAFVASVRDSVEAVFSAISVDSADVITLTSSTGSGIPVTVSSDASEPLRVTVRLAPSQYLRSAPSIDLELAPGTSQAVTLHADLLRPGRFTVKLQVLAPDGRILDKQELKIRSTAYNRIALIITVAAAVVLFAMWARRFLPRRTS